MPKVTGNVAAALDIERAAGNAKSLLREGGISNLSASARILDTVAARAIALAASVRNDVEVARSIIANMEGGNNAAQ